ncbi:MAG: PKD domain-containing protein [Candidatus Thiodiazotropha sp. (ex Epidulcina cf. delphinae)]|nr:PKD domain-containing protein [Candidatus Thiodiazotropha sp. (ex Epidulcina cf. delphinae)]
MTSTNKQTNEIMNQRTKTTTSFSYLIHVTLTFLAISYQLSAVSYAADFAGSLKGVTITDSDGANTPPTAVINYTQNGDTVDFDASGSSDMDGSIAEYRWDFSDGLTATGQMITHQYVSSGNFPVTLTVIDDQGAVALTQQMINMSGPVISDNFTDSSVGDYSVVSGQLTIANGIAYGQTWKLTRAYHNTPLTGDNYWVEADVSYDGSSRSAGVIIRGDTSNMTGYDTYFSNGRINLSGFQDTSSSWVGLYDGEYGTGVYKVKVEASGDNLKVYVDGTMVIDKTDNQYPTGVNAGIRFYTGGSGTDIYVDNLSAYQ